MAAPSSCGLSGTADCPSFPDPPYNSVNPTPSTYVVNSKIMVVAVAVLFAVVVFILCLHVYAKWFWRHQGALGATDGTLRTVSWRRRRRAANPDLDSNTNSNTSTNNPLAVQSVGLEKSVIAALPMFEFDSKVGALECAVCLEEFEDGEKGRTLPKCGHHFHLDCVDMWLHSHSTCPLCRASVRPEEEKGVAAEPLPHVLDAPVIGDVHAPFMAAMRASRRRQRSRNASSHTGVVPSHNLIMENAPTESSATSEPDHETTTTPSIPPVDPKALALQYETPATGIPANVLFWGNQTTPGAQPSASQQLPIRAPFQVTIDIPGGSSQSAGVVMSPMARASASFKRLLSRGKSVVSPQEDGQDEGGPSTSPHRQTPPSPPPPPNHVS